MPVDTFSASPWYEQFCLLLDCRYAEYLKFDPLEKRPIHFRKSIEDLYLPAINPSQQQRNESGARFYLTKLSLLHLTQFDDFRQLAGINDCVFE